MSNLVAIRSISEFIDYRSSLGKALTIGFVPTMGALHRGHAELIKRAASENDICIVSIFINPTQFNNSEDLNKYPRTPDSDLAVAREHGANVVLSPPIDEMYPDKYNFQLKELSFSKMLCGAHRPGHFEGMLTIVMKLLNLVYPDRAYFGEKDFQQLQLIRELQKAFFIRTQIIACPTVREPDGLALSSRNLRLTDQGRAIAPQIFKALNECDSTEKAVAYLKSKNIDVEYVEEHFNRRFIAAHIDGVRLIDNVAIK